MAGFLKPPAGNLQSHGYRSWKTGLKDSGMLLEGSDVSYNGFVFPPHLKSDGTVVQEYDSSGRTVKNLLIVITVKFILTPYGITGGIGEGPTTDDQMRSIRERLSQNGQALSFILQGFGPFYINGLPTSGAPVVAGQSILYDVDYGPKTQVVGWKPIAGGAASEVEWLVTTRIPACESGGSINGLSGVLEFNYSVDWDIDNAGLMNRTVSGHIEVVGGRQANSGSIHASNQVNINDKLSQMDRVIAALRQTFPQQGGWHRQEHFGVSENRKVMNFVFADTEIPSATPIPKGILDINLTESLKSTIDEGFNLWSWTLSGDIKVPHSKRGNHDIVSNKHVAFSALYKILQDRLNRVGRTVRFKLKPGEKPTPSTPTERVAKAYPTLVEINSEVFGTGFDVAFGFMLTCPPAYLFQVTGMFDAVRTAGVTWDQWRDFLIQSGTRIPYLDVLPGYEGIVDLCHPVAPQPNPSTSPRRNPLATRNDQIIVDEVPSESESWIQYNNEFSYETESYTTAVPVLSSQATPKAIGTNEVDSNPRRSVAFVPTPETGLSTGEQATSSWMRPDIQSAIEPIQRITMRGKAVRIGYPINPPELLTVGGTPVYKIGKDKVVPRKIASGFTKNGEVTNIYLLTWERSYILSGPPTRSGDAKWDLQSTGHPELYA